VKLDRHRAMREALTRLAASRPDFSILNGFSSEFWSFFTWQGVSTHL
jgi:hypothetical protein